MKIRNPFVLRSLGFVAAWILRLWLGTLRYRILFPAGVVHPADPRRERFIYAFWHESFLAPAFVRTRIHALISHHADGELIAQVCRGLRYGVIRGSTTRGGVSALKELVRIAGKSHLLVTPDGPRGPRRSLQPGLIYLASRTGLPIVVVGVGFAHAWRARSWDRFAVPRPWSTLCAVVSEGVAVPPVLTRHELEDYRSRVEEHFLRLTEAAERWAAGGPRPMRPPPFANTALRTSA
jgi:lysophospholipid acyltransferase (LPLAT)-like uncharacterized protein